VTTTNATPLTSIPAGTWSVDPVHSAAEFQVRNMGIVTVKGYFDDIEGSLETGDEIKVRGTAKTASVQTRSAKRDEHLRSADFFDAEQYPEIAFESTRIEAAGEGRFRVIGDLTIKGTTREVVFDAALEGTTPDPWGGERVGVSATTTIDRRDFGLVWDVRTPTDIPLVSHKVRIELHVGAVKA
jgi:polyisoprenoid-binding protein YceI